MLRSWPRELMVILTSRCNLECVMCCREVSNKLLPEEAAFKLAVLFPYLETVNWQGGEAFTVPYFKRLVAAAAEHPRIEQWITTSGILITRDWAELLVRAGVRLGLSIDGATAPTYEKIRRGATFPRLLQTLEWLVEAEEASGRRPPKTMTVTVMRSNIGELDLFLDLAKRYRIDSVSFAPVLYIEDEENVFFHRDAAALEALRRARPRLESRARELGLGLEWRIPLPAEPGSDAPRPPAKGAPAPEARSGPLCRKPWKKLHVNAISDGGNAYPECYCPGERYTGNLLHHDVAALWNSPVMQEYRARMLAGTSRGFCSDACLSGQVDPALLS